MPAAAPTPLAVACRSPVTPSRWSPARVLCSRLPASAFGASCVAETAHLSVPDGAYGLRWRGLDDRAHEWLVAAPVAWPQWRVRRRLGTRSMASFIDETKAQLPLMPGGTLQVDRGTTTVTY